MSLLVFLITFTNISSHNKGCRESSETRDKRERRRPLRAKRAKNVQGLAITFGKFLLAYFMRPPDLEALGVMKPLGP